MMHALSPAQLRLLTVTDKGWNRSGQQLNPEFSERKFLKKSGKTRESLNGHLLVLKMLS